MGRWHWHVWAAGRCLRCGIAAQGADNPYDYLDVAERID